MRTRFKVIRDVIADDRRNTQASGDKAPKNPRRGSTKDTPAHRRYYRTCYIILTNTRRVSSFQNKHPRFLATA